MTQGEKRFLVVGLLVGLSIAGLTHAVLRVKETPAPTEAATRPPEAQSAASSTVVDLRLDEPAKVGTHAMFRARIQESGRPVTDAHVWLTLILAEMDSNGREEIRVSTDLSWNGTEYLGKAYIPLPGRWKATVGVGEQGHPYASSQIDFEAR